MTSSRVPALSVGLPAIRTNFGLARRQRRSELTVAAHEVALWERSTIHALDSEALARAHAHDLELEISFADAAALLAGNSEAKLILAARKLDALSQTNTARATRTFGS